jgi:hypothetical protein
MIFFLHFEIYLDNFHIPKLSWTMQNMWYQITIINYFWKKLFFISKNT